MARACERRIIRNAAGSTFLEISGRELSKLVVTAPSTTEQRRIGQQLAALDDEVDLLRARLEALRTQKRGLMQKLLTGAWRLDERFDGSSGEHSPQTHGGEA
jgi:type I restriction enzyme S subunit